jgi:hypothetical protein
MSLRSVLTSGLLYVGLATAQQRYAHNQANVIKDSEEASKNFQDVEDLKLESPAFTDPKSIPAGFENGTSGPTDDATLGMSNNTTIRYTNTNMVRILSPEPRIS